MRRVVVPFLFAVCTSAQLWAQEIKPNWPVPPELKWEAINGYPMAYGDAGEGTPIVNGARVDKRLSDLECAV
ncbi:hypothetical protein [Bradyrhizobium centrosematis]|uniref:hypothetical protein n=1 Tax=Bradyrhizobium centrosematis TaxID=1300039 RepID=UPI002168235E|nr:hypothetical protein [Bradyrhizobium centrosematis]MCS3763102.1 hypothetical protein [Bradyrhizobium centrosematis]MCS3775769.1 hypothetical protein [Bradyrhizobium centrosematis]